MAQLQDEFNAIVAQIEERIQNAEDLNFIKQKIADISMLYIDELNKIMDLTEKRVNQVYENQKIIEGKVLALEKGVGNIEKELYIDEDEEYDFEIVCPYCNHEFATDINSDMREVTCPECHNVIELDWNQGEDECGGHCGGCHGCETTQEEEQNQDEDDDM